MNEPPLDLRALAAILRRGWIAIVLSALLATCGGILYGLRGRSQPSAVALVYVPPATNGAVTDDIRTQTVIATSARVLTPAIRSLPAPVPLDQLKVAVTTVGTTNVLRVAVHAPERQQAIKLANAVANGYIHYASQNGLVTGQPLLIQPASTADSASARSRLVTTGCIGLAAGLLLGAAVVLIRSRRDRRLRRRDEIAHAIGLPVLANIEAGIYKDVTDWTRFLEEFHPAPTALWNLRRVLHHVLTDYYGGDVMIRVVSYADDRAALAAGPQLAVAASELGMSSEIDPGMEDVLAPLRAACAAVNRSAHIEQRASTSGRGEESGSRRPSERQYPGAGSFLVISIFTLDRSNPELPPFAGRSILAISPGVALADDLALLALAASEGGGDIEGIMLVNPASGDSGAGMAPERKDESRTARLVNGYSGNGATVVGDRDDPVTHPGSRSVVEPGVLTGRDRRPHY